jgi:hypothetical protein
MAHPQDAPILFHVGDTPVKVAPSSWGAWAALWAALAWWVGRRHRERSWPARVVTGGLSALILAAADLGHAAAHTVSARYAGAPTDEVYVAQGLSRTLYFDDQVPPRVHRMRSLGGPLFNALALSISLLWRAFTRRGTLAREMADWLCGVHGLVLAISLAPVPIFDGGVLLKWSLVERGHTPTAADGVVRWAGLATGVAALAAGGAMAARRRRAASLGLVATGAIAFAALGKIR